MRGMKSRGELPRPIDFVAMGHLAVDYRNGERFLGGAAAYGCLAAARLGRASAMVTAVGEDFDLFEPLEGIEIHYHRSRESTVFRNEYVGAERRQRLSSRARPLSASDWDGLRAKLTDSATVFYCPIAQEIEAPLVPLTPAGRCGVAAQGFFRAWDQEGWVRPCVWEQAGTALSDAELVSVSASDVPSTAELARLLADEERTLAITEGAEGARVYAEGRCYWVPAFQRRAIDPTGAGDVFAASFLIALSEGRPPLDAAQFATCAASFVVESAGVGGVPPSRRAVEDRLASYRSSYRPAEIAP
jgi:pfkB family carbohydrate kinase